MHRMIICLLSVLAVCGAAATARADQPPTIVVPSGSEPYNSSIYRQGASQAVEPITLGIGSQLLVDDYLIKSSSGLTRRVNAPLRDPQIPNPLVTGVDDECVGPYTTVVRDPQTGQFRLWYNTYQARPATGDYTSKLSTMQSADGIQWVRPHQDTNVPGVQGDQFFGASVIDEGLAFGDPSQRYKLLWEGSGNGGTIATSADGLTWTKLTTNPFVLSNHDIYNIARDPVRNCYVATFSAYTTGPTWSGTRRVALQTTSTDLINWQQPRYVLTPDDSTDPGLTQFYSMSGYVTRGGLTIGLVKVLHDNWTASDVPAGAYGMGYTTLAWTRDGVNWTRDQTPFFEPDPDPNAWDHAHAWLDYQLDMGDETYIYYGGYKYGHKYEPATSRSIGLVRMERNRYVSRDAGAEGGTLVTPVFVTDASGITINAAVDGALNVRVVDQDGQPLPGFGWSDFSTIQGDSLCHAAQWASAFSTLRGTRIALEFSITNGQLYGFDLIHTPEPGSLVLLTAGAIGVFGYAWRKRK